MEPNLLMISVTIVVLESLQPCLTRNITKIFKRYSYSWNEVLVPYNDLNPCREGFWTLEIYDDEVQKEVDGFIDHLLVKNAPIGNQYVILNMFCENETECTWKNASERVTYFNWNVSNSINSNYNDKQIVYYLKATNQNKGHKHTWNKMFLDETKQTFARICMQGDLRTLNTDSNTFNHGISIEINQSTAKTNFAECFRSYCYFWNGNIVRYSQLEQCPEPFWDLEIYEEKVEAEVFKFVELLIDNNFGILGYFVPLNLSCQNLTTCTWKHKNQPAAHLNWEQGVKWVDKDDVIYFQARKSNELKQWNRFDKNIKHPCAKLCMKENSDPSKITDAITSKHANVINNSSSYGFEISNASIRISIGILIPFIALFTLGIIIFVILRKKRNSGIDEPKALPPVDDKNVEESSGDNSSYDHLKIRKDLTNSVLYQPLELYENVKHPTSKPC